MTVPPIRTPCVRECCVDGSTGLCLGCGRTMKEITSWTRFTDTERDAICEALPARKRAAGLPVYETPR
ncbi:MAG: DUF1289 domain-containing protein [Caulobacterales bacterium]